MEKIKIYSFRNFFERLLFEVIFQFTLGWIFLFIIIIIHPDRNSPLTSIAVIIFIIQLVLAIFYKLFNNANLIIEPDGIRIKRFDGTKETIKWDEVIDASFENLVHNKRLIRIELNLKLINNKSITISLERFIGQYSPLIPYKKLKESFPTTLNFQDIDKTEPGNNDITKLNSSTMRKSFWRIFNKETIPLFIIIAINSILFIYSMTHNKTPHPVPIILIIFKGLISYILGSLFIGAMLGFIVAIFPYKNMNYQEKFGRSFWIGIWIIQILFLLLLGAINIMFYLKTH